MIFKPAWQSTEGLRRTLRNSKPKTATRGLRSAPDGFGHSINRVISNEAAKTVA